MRLGPTLHVPEQLIEVLLGVQTVDHRVRQRDIVPSSTNELIRRLEQFFQGLLSPHVGHRRQHHAGARGDAGQLEHGIAVADSGQAHSRSSRRACAVLHAVAVADELVIGADEEIRCVAHCRIVEWLSDPVEHDLVDFVVHCESGHLAHDLARRQVSLEASKAVEQCPHVRRHPICEDTHTVLWSPVEDVACVSIASVSAPSSQRKMAFVTSQRPKRNFMTRGSRCSMAGNAHAQGLPAHDVSGRGAAYA
eukprot:CAMPEP_0170400946 /NCGR_PEP_ID=MMETSP0117_2-20130122/24763_1 /TAXON_ID=400756 /ORGANISM="Durinskia baltica, Strain CSIRO CS-38" /LENGTH=249 /DNA_ID=CAMNT_0010657717 /DNA_START=229 /DNA_END=975 /DNA_ORIENTATION=+